MSHIMGRCAARARQAAGSRRALACGLLLASLAIPGPALRAQSSDLVVGVPRFGVAVPMRDGVRLDAHVWVPDTAGRFPAILIRTPYVKTPQFKRYGLARYVREGYAVVLQDTRGRGDSQGEFDFYFPEGRDGFDTIEWIARQPWSNGRVGMDGGSYLGTVQWLAARERPPALKCITPTAPSGRIFDEVPYLGGAFRLDWALPWLNGVAGQVAQNDLAELVDWQRIAAHRPLLTADRAFGREMPLYRSFLQHDTLDDYWKRIQFTDADFAAIDIPVLTVTGWFDGDQIGALFHWDGVERRGDLADRTYLIVGPWTHPQTYLGGAERVGAYQLGPEAVHDIQRTRVNFFDWCLKGATARFDAPRVRLFVTGANRWISADRYPLPQVRTRELFLRSDGAANTAAGDGRLSWDPPRRAERPDTFSYDPRRPVPSKGVAQDHADLGTRADVLVYSTDPLAEPLDVLGRVFVRLVAASDGPDTDFTAKLLDVHPDGRAVLVGPSPVGVRRARYRQGYERQVPLTPGRPEELSIELFDVGHRFLPGHRIRIEISSSAYPFIDPNPNTGLPVATDTTWRVARQTVFHDSARRSRVLLPVVPGGIESLSRR